MLCDTEIGHLNLSLFPMNRFVRRWTEFNNWPKIRWPTTEERRIKKPLKLDERRERPDRFTVINFRYYNGIWSTMVWHCSIERHGDNNKYGRHIGFEIGNCTLLHGVNEGNENLYNRNSWIYSFFRPRNRYSIYWQHAFF